MPDVPPSANKSQVAARTMFCDTTTIMAQPPLTSAIDQNKNDWRSMFCHGLGKAVLESPVRTAVGENAAFTIPQTGTNRQPITNNPCTITASVYGTANCQKLTPNNRTQLIGNKYFRQVIITWSIRSR